MILVCYGTRPEHLKIEPLLKHWKSIGFNDWKVWLTGQHEELCNNLEETWEFRKHIVLNGGPGDYTTPSNRLDGIIHDVMSQAHYLWMFGDNKCDAILVQGDTASAFACALTAFHRQIPIIHLEAGLRSYDNASPFPEEMYRRCISNMASIHLCPTEDNAINLSSESVGGIIHVVGNTILDPLVDLKSTNSKIVICTLHRRENQSQIEEWFKNLELMAERNPQFKFVLPIHKNPDIYKFKSMFKSVWCIEPLDHQDMIYLLQRCSAVVTDSGGIVEEATWFRKPIFLCRTSTERPEAEEFYTWIQEPQMLSTINIESQIQNKDFSTFSCPFGDGKSSEKITEALIEQGIIKMI